MEEIRIKTNKAEEFITLDQLLNQYLKRHHAKNGILTVFCPHTTAAITINENGDPFVKKDLSLGLSMLSPIRKEYLHQEGNSHAHLKASCIGASETVFYQDGKVLLGTWQSIYFWEFDGPRVRKIWVEHMEKEDGDESRKKG